MGRPPLAEGKAKEIVFTLRLSPEERDEIVEASKRVGKPARVWARDVLLLAAHRECTPQRG
jgi:hypothetical protein